jgi:hypothetical protein
MIGLCLCCYFQKKVNVSMIYESHFIIVESVNLKFSKHFTTLLARIVKNIKI